MNIYLILFAGIGITNLIVNSSVLDYPRDFLSSKSELISTLLSCMMCSGFWVGIILGIFMGINPLLLGPIVSLSSMIFNSLINYIELLSAEKINQIDQEI